MHGPTGDLKPVPALLGSLGDEGTRGPRYSAVHVLSKDPALGRAAGHLETSRNGGCQTREQRFFLTAVQPVAILEVAAEVAELADARDSKSRSFGSVGSSPTFGTSRL